MRQKSALVFGLNYGPNFSPLEEIKNKKTDIYLFMLEEKIITRL